MLTMHYRRWCPPHSPLGIEFPPELLHEVRLEGAQAATAARLSRTRARDRAEDHSSGILYGTRQNQEVRILAARSSQEAGDPRLAGMQPVGVFVCRARGEVFLTDADLALFETVEGSVALVVAGGRAGFFVREADGSVQAVRSHEEFAVASVAATVVPAITHTLLRPALPPKRILKRAMTGTGLLCVPLAALMYLQPALPQPPLAVAVHEEAGQLVIDWQAYARTELGRLDIVDGDERIVIPLAPGQSNVTYAHRTGDVEIRLATGTREGFVRWEGAARSVPKTVNSGVAENDLVKLEREAKILRASVERGRTHTKVLLSRIGQLSDR
jgi:hypothetical protein